MQLALAGDMLNTMGVDASGLNQLPGKLKPRFEPGYWWLSLVPRA